MVPPWIRREGDEAVCGVGQVPESRPWRGQVPVDEAPLGVADDQVPWGQVVMDDQVVPIGWNRHLPPRIRRRREAGERVMEITDQAADVGNLIIMVEQVESVRPGHHPWRKRKHFAAPIYGQLGPVERVCLDRLRPCTLARP